MNIIRTACISGHTTSSEQNLWKRNKNFSRIRNKWI